MPQIVMTARDMHSLSHKETLKLIKIFNHTLSIGGIVYAFTQPEYLWYTIVVYYLFSSIGVSVGFHRYLSHKSFKTNKFWHVTMSLMGTLMAQGSSIAWVAVHRQHHKYTDKPKDPHSIHQIGVLRSWFTMWNKNTLEHNNKDIIQDPVQKWLHKNYLNVHLLVILLLASLDPWLVIYAYAMPGMLTTHTSGLFNTAAHWNGYRNHKTNDKSMNTWYVNIFGLGEGWHNNHHANPSSFTTKEKWWEIDPLAWFIKAIKV